MPGASSSQPFTRGDGVCAEFIYIVVTAKRAVSVHVLNRCMQSGLLRHPRHPTQRTSGGGGRAACWRWPAEGSADGDARHAFLFAGCGRARSSRPQPRARSSHFSVGKERIDVGRVAR